MGDVSPQRIGFVTGMRMEAACIERATGRGLPEDLPVICAGGRAVSAGEGARQLIGQGAVGLVSFGLAGGLAPGLAPGDLVLAEAVVLPDGSTIATDPGWTARLAALAAAPGVRVAVMRHAGSDEAVATPAAKADLHRATGARTVDMESHAVAVVALAGGVPFVVLRAIADPAARAIPAIAMAGLAPDGTTRPLPVLAGLLSRPGDVLPLLRLALDSRAGLAALRAVALRLAPSAFGLP